MPHYGEISNGVLVYFVSYICVLHQTKDILKGVKFTPDQFEQFDKCWRLIIYIIIIEFWFFIT